MTIAVVLLELDPDLCLDLASFLFLSFLSFSFFASLEDEALSTTLSGDPDADLEFDLEFDLESIEFDLDLDLPDLDLDLDLDLEESDSDLFTDLLLLVDSDLATEWLSDLSDLLLVLDLREIRSVFLPLFWEGDLDLDLDFLS